MRGNQWGDVRVRHPFNKVVLLLFAVGLVGAVATELTSGLVTSRKAMPQTYASQLNNLGPAQQLLEVPRYGTFYSLQNDWPPVPYHWLADLGYSLPVYSVGNPGEGVFVVDDRLVDYEALNQAQMQLRSEAEAVLGMGGIQLTEFESTQYSEGSLWLEPIWTPSSGSLFPMLVHGTEVGVEYKVLGRIALNSAYQSLEAAVLGALTAPQATALQQGREMVFFRAVRADADTDGDRMPDWWELVYGLNPGANADAGGDADGDGLSNLEEYAGRTNPRVAEQLLGFVAEPKQGVISHE